MHLVWRKRHSFSQSWSDLGRNGKANHSLNQSSKYQSKAWKRVYARILLFSSARNEAKMSPRWGQDQSQMRPGWTKNEAQMDEEWGPNGWRMRPEWTENGARMDEEWDGGGLGMDSSLNGLMDWVLSRPDWRRIEAGLERNWGLNDVRPHLISPVCCWAWEMDSGCYRTYL